MYYWSSPTVSWSSLHHVTKHFIWIRTSQTLISSKEHQWAMCAGHLSGTNVINEVLWLCAHYWVDLSRCFRPLWLSWGWILIPSMDGTPLFVSSDELFVGGYALRCQSTGGCECNTLPEPPLRPTVGYLQQKQCLMSGQCERRPQQPSDRPNGRHPRKSVKNDELDSADMIYTNRLNKLSALFVLQQHKWTNWTWSGWPRARQSWPWKVQTPTYDIEAPVRRH